jgi:glycosyltransferase involved in cell wall biosynthesis
MLGKVSGITRLPGFIGLLGNIARRRSYLAQALLEANTIIAPSQTLHDLYVRNGIPGERVLRVPYGHDIGWAEQVDRNVAPSLRFAFLGNIIPAKGVHILVEACRLIQDIPGWEMHIHGNDLLHPDYAADVRSALPPNVVWHGSYAHQELPILLSETDVVVVPSIWHENAPLVVQEAFAAQCPVIVSDLGGVAEGVRDGVNGLHFRASDPADLSEKLKFMAMDPETVEAMRNHIPSVKTVSEELQTLRMIYESLL